VSAVVEVDDLVVELMTGAASCAPSTA